MAAKTFTMTNGTRTAGQALDADSKVLKITGTLQEGTVRVFISETDADYAIAYESEGIPPNPLAFPIPAGWYVACQVVNILGTLNVKVAIQ